MISAIHGIICHHDIDYIIGLFIDNGHYTPNYEAYFEDFYAHNTFIRENKDKRKYLDNEMGYTLIERIDGKPGPCCRENRMEWQEFSNEQIQHEIDSFIKNEEDLKKLLQD